MKTANKIVMTVVGLILIVAAILKAHQILTTVIPTYQQISQQYTGFEFYMRVLECREILIFHVPLELGLGIWMISGLFRKSAWLLSIFTFIFFAIFTGYKVVNGYADCGCFGVVKIDPRITLLAVDIPAVLLLAAFWPKGTKFFKKPNLKYFIFIAVITAAILIPSTAYLLASKPVEPEPVEQAGVLWDKLDHISQNEKLSAGMWIVLMFHHDCPDCREAIPKYQAIAPNFEGSIDFAFIEIPPYGDLTELNIDENSTVLVDRLDQSKDWIIQTPRTLLLVDGVVIKVWDAYAPDIDEVFGAIEGY